MPTSTKARRPAKKSTPAPEPEVEVEDLEVEDDTVEDDEVDDLEVEDAEEEPEPAPKATKKAAAKEKKPAAEPPQFGSAWLAEHVNEQTGSSYNAFGIRTLLRSLVKKGVLNRDVGTDRSRYNFSGPKDPIVREVIKAIKSGEAEKAKKEKIEEAQQKAAAKKAPAKAAKKAAPKAAEPEVEDDDEEDVEDL